MSILQQFIDQANEDSDRPSEILMTAVCKAVVEATRESNPDRHAMVTEARKFLATYKRFVVVHGGFAKGVVGVYGLYTKAKAFIVWNEIGEEQGVICEVLTREGEYPINRDYVHVLFDPLGKASVQWECATPNLRHVSNHKLSSYPPKES